MECLKLGLHVICSLTAFSKKKPQICPYFCWSFLPVFLKLTFLLTIALKHQMVMLQNPLQSIQQISSFLGCNHNKEFLEEVVRLTSFENMKMVEQQRNDALLEDYWKEENPGFVWKGL